MYLMGQFVQKVEDIIFIILCDPKLFELSVILADPYLSLSNIFNTASIPHHYCSNNDCNQQHNVNQQQPLSYSFRNHIMHRKYLSVSKQ